MKSKVAGLDFDGLFVIGLILPVPGVRQFIQRLKDTGYQPIIITARRGWLLRIAEYWLRISKIKVPMVGHTRKAGHLKKLDVFFYIESSQAKIQEFKNLQELSEVHFAWFFAYSSYLPPWSRKLLKRFVIWSGMKRLFSFSEKRFSSLDELLIELSAKLDQT